MCNHILNLQHATLAVVLLTTGSLWADTPVYTEDFGDGLGGWKSSGTASHAASEGALDNGPYMKCSSRKNSNWYKIMPDAHTILTGNLRQNFATSKLLFSFYAKTVHPGINTITVIIEDKTTQFQRSVVRVGAGWKHVAFAVDTDWSNLEADQNSWKEWSKGDASWKEVCRNVASQFIVVSSPAKPDRQPADMGLDDITVAGRAVLKVKPVPKGKTAPADSGYVDKVRIMLDNMIEFGRDRYGKEHSPLFAAILEEDTLDCPEDPPDYTVDPVRLDPGRYLNRRSSGGGDIYHDQAMLKCMDLMSQLTGDPSYREAALDALRFALNRAVDSKGFPAMGGHMYWHFYNDMLSAHGELHELWNWPLTWDLWWAADPEKMKQYAQLMWEWHVHDKSTGETNRHSDKKPGGAFSFSSASMISQWGFVAAHTKLEPYQKWCATVAGYYWSRRNRNTNMFDSQGSRGGGGYFTTMQATVARDWIVAGRQTNNRELVEWGRSILDAYAKYGYDKEKGLFYSSVKVDGTPLEPHVERDLVTGDEGLPTGYLAIWQPHAAWQEEPLAMAQAYAWAAENVDKQAYLPTAEKFGHILVKAWQRRYADCKDWSGLCNLLKPLDVEHYKIRGVLHSRHIKTAKVDAKAMEVYRKGGYVYQAPFGMFADHYARMIQFSLSMHRLTNDPRWLRLARQVADEAVKQLWRGKLFVGHPMKKHYMNTDHVGILLYALLQLDGAQGGNDLKIDVLF